MPWRFPNVSPLACNLERRQTDRELDPPIVPTGCIALQILLLDSVPSVGYRSYLNFQTSYTPKMLRDVDTVLRAAQARAAAQHTSAACLKQPVPIMAAQHHPMSVVQYPGLRAHSGYLRRLQSLLARYRVHVFVSGHLHDAFGDRQHVCHSVSQNELTLLPSEVESCPNSDAMAAQHQQNACMSVSSVENVHVHANRRCVLEMESPGWRSSRHFRLMSFAGGAFSATDARIVISRHSSSDEADSNAFSSSPALHVASGPTGVLRSMILSECL
jgi:hypothetical protein